MTQEYTFKRIKNYDINCDDYINDVYSIFYKGFEIKYQGTRVVVEVVAKSNLNFNIENIRDIMIYQDKCSVIFAIVDVLDCDQNFYIVWDDFLSEYQSINNIDINDLNIMNIYMALREILIFVIENDILCDVIIYDQIFINKNNGTIRVLLRPLKKKKNVIYGSPIYSPKITRTKQQINLETNQQINLETNQQINLETNHDETIVTNIGILLYEISIKRITNRFSSLELMMEDLTDSDYSEFISMLLDPKVNYKHKINKIRNTTDIKNKSLQNIADNNDINCINGDIFVMDL
jgi:hypothetical protein